jgi:hypothetical protein
MFSYHAFEWWRIGQVVTVRVFFRLAVAGSVGNGGTFLVENYPYQGTASENRYQSFNPVWVSDVISPATSYPVIFAQTSNLPSQAGDVYTGDKSLFVFTDLDMAAAIVIGSQIKANGQWGYQSTYITDDTTWQPINGATVS